METPTELRYSTDHEWVRVEDSLVRIGITDFAQDALGDVVYVELPEVGAQVAQNASFAEVESTKSVSDIFAPVSGEIAEVNDALEDQPELVNEDPYGDGWICIIQVNSLDELDAVMDADGFRSFVSEDGQE